MSEGRYFRIQCIGMSVCGGVVLLGGVILFYFDPTQYHFYPTCIFHQATGLLCPGCGCLRALHQLLHGHLVNAFRFNPLLVIAPPLAASFAAAYWARNHQQETERLFNTPRCLWVMGLVFLVISIWRNLPGAPILITPP